MEFNLGTDKQTFLSKLIKSIFISYLENYIEVEIGYLKSRSAVILQRYYDSKNHQKRSIGTGGWVFLFFKREKIYCNLEGEKNSNCHSSLYDELVKMCWQNHFVVVVVLSLNVSLH